MEINKKIIGIIGTGMVGLIIANFWMLPLEKDEMIRIFSVLIGFVLIYFSYYSIQIKMNESRINKIEKWREEKEEL